MNSKHSVLWLLCLSAAFGLSACDGGSKAPAPKKEVQAQNQNAIAQTDSKQQTESQNNFLSDTQALQAAEDTLKSLPQFGGKPLNIFQSIEFHGGGQPKIEVDIQDPEKPDNIDHYIYQNGQWGEPQPVQITGGGNMKDNVFPLDKIRFATVAIVAQNWHDKAKEVEAKKTEPDFILFKLLVDNQELQWITPDIDSPRAQYRALFSLDGSLKELKKQ